MRFLLLSSARLMEREVLPRHMNASLLYDETLPAVPETWGGRYSMGGMMVMGRAFVGATIEGLQY